MKLLILLLVASTLVIPSKERNAKPYNPVFTTLPRNLTETTDKDVIDILNKYKAITYIGSFNGKSFYIDTYAKTQTSANESCVAMGLKLVEFHTQSEVDYLGTFSGLPNYCWTGGELVESLSNYKWTHSSAPIGTSLSLEYGQKLGLVLVKYTDYGRLRPYFEGYSQCYYCYH